MLGRQLTAGVIGSVALCLGLATQSGGCKRVEARTQVMLVIDAELDVRALATQVQVDIESRGALGQSSSDSLPSSYVFQPMEASSPSWPLSVALVPRGRDATRSYHITATLSDAAGPIARMRIDSGFVGMRTLALRRTFTLDCLYTASLGCDDSQTCEHGVCVSAAIDARSLPALASDAADGFAFAADGGVWDATSARHMSAVMTGQGESLSSAGAGDATGAAGAAGQPVPTMPTVPSMLTTPNAPGDCGDGRIDPGELCDTAISPGVPGACPTQCVTDNPCQPVQLDGSGCLTQCKVFAIVVHDSGDGCCPAGADATSDSDCAARCGNGIIEPGETCDPVDTCPNLASCTSASVCLKASVAGDAARCNATCVMQPIEVCVAGDACCPASCSHATDSDCSVSCGDGVVDANAGELCEPTSATQACPTACDDANACTRDYFTGSASNCNLACTSVPTRLAISGDGCCPPGAYANIDSDCQPICGNGIVERGERCDGRCPTLADCNDANPCTLDGVAGTGCGVGCTHVAVNAAVGGDSCCPAGANANNDSDCSPVCGNGVRESGEVCDGDCPRSCDDHNACTADEIVNAGCQRVCAHRALSASGAQSDGCCPDPSKLRAHDDVDCPSECGNLFVEKGETCDPCPTQCTDTDPCTKDVPAGPACSVTCTHTSITVPMGGDGCCPKGNDSSTDNDCKNPPAPVCGNNMKEAGEVCDGNDCPVCEDTNPCTREQVTPNPDKCHPKCEHLPIAPNPMTTDGCCPMGSTSVADKDCAPICGNGAVEAGEMCDPCPTSCDDAKPCTHDMLVGSGCNATCSHEPITATISGDGCCPNPTITSDLDSDCMTPPPTNPPMQP